MNQVTENTAESILERIAEVFAEKGYDGARVSELAAASGVNKATLYYQIGDKEALYHAVLERAFRGTAERMEAAVAASDDCEAQIRGIVAVFAHTTGNLRYAAPILLREIASGGRNLSEGAFEQMSRIIGTLTGSLTHGVQQGRFRPVNTFMVHMMIVGSLSFYAANEPIRRHFSEHHPEVAGAMHFPSNEEAGKQIADLILASIRIPPANNKEQA